MEFEKQIKEFEESINSYNELKQSLPGDIFEMVHLELISLIKTLCFKHTEMEIKFLAPPQAIAVIEPPMIDIPNIEEEGKVQPVKAYDIFSKPLEEGKEDCRLCIKCGEIRGGLTPKCEHFICSDCLTETMSAASGGTFHDETFFCTLCPACDANYSLEEILQVFDWDWLKEKKSKVAASPPARLCPIDLTPLGEGDIELKCGHGFHRHCMSEYLSSRKAMSKRSINCPCNYCPIPLEDDIIKIFYPTYDPTNILIPVAPPPLALDEKLRAKIDAMGQGRNLFPHQIGPMQRAGAKTYRGVPMMDIPIDKEFKFEVEGANKGQVVRLDPGDPLFQHVSKHFAQSQQKGTQLVAKLIWRIDKKHGDIAFMNKMKMNFMELNIKYMFHGTSEDAVESIVKKTSGTGFKMPKRGGNLGKGLYFAEDPGKCVPYIRDHGCLIIRTMICLGVKGTDYKTGTFMHGYEEYCVYSRDQCQPCEIIFFGQQ